MTFTNLQEYNQDHQRVDADLVLQIMEYIHEQLDVEMRQSQDRKREWENHSQVPLQNIEVGLML